VFVVCFHLLCLPSFPLYLVSFCPSIREGEQWLMRTPVLDKSIEFADKRISLFAAQYVRCAITGTELMLYDIRCHHKVPLENGGTDKYSNLVLVTEAVHLLIHATLEETIQKYLKQLQLHRKQMEKLNELRKLAGTPAIV